MPDLYAYTDYRAFLADCYRERKAADAAFSYQTISEIVGFHNRGFIHNVIRGVKNLSPASVAKLSKALRFDPQETGYFENLVAFNQAKTLQERNRFFERLNAVKGRRQGSAALRETRQDQHELHAAWQVAAIRSYLRIHPFNGDYRQLARTLVPPVKVKEAKRAVQVLEKFGHVKKRGDGCYEAVDADVSAETEVVRLGLANFQAAAMELAARALHEVPEEKRHLSGVTLCVSKARYCAICLEIQKFQEQLARLTKNDPGADRVYQLNFHFFPISE